jgi:glycosyltransferase involved in cell wall biosynthesis
MASFIRSENIQVVHGFMHKGSMGAALAGRLSSAPVILTSRRNLGYHHTRWSLTQTRIANRFVTRIVANSEKAKQVTAEIEGVDPGIIDVLYNGVNTDDFYPSSAPRHDLPVAIPRDSRVVGIVANYRPVKDLVLFLKAAAIVTRTSDDVYFLLVGRGPLEHDLRALANELNISDRVIFTCGNGEVLPYLHRMCIGCLSSESEGFSNSLLEYMAVGLPVVAVDVGGNSEAVVDGKTGFLVRSRTPEAFAAPILRLLADESMRLRMGQAGLQRCLKEFDIAGAATRLADYYDGLCGKAAVSNSFPSGGKVHIS